MENFLASESDMSLGVYLPLDEVIKTEGVLEVVKISQKTISNVSISILSNPREIKRMPSNSNCV